MLKEKRKLFRAHISEDGMREQTVNEHLVNVAQLSKQFMKSIQCETLGYLTGILHDAGKYTEAFDRYILESVENKDSIAYRYKLNHSAAGAILLTQLVGAPETSIGEAVLQMICEAIFSHHSGLLDNYTPMGEEGYSKRFQPTSEIYYEEVKHNFFENVASKEEILELFQKAVDEVSAKIKNITGKNTMHVFYAVGLLEKFLFSSLVDADWYDTECFMSNKSVVYKNKEHTKTWKILIERLEHANNQFSTELAINQFRREISDGCKRAFEYQPGCYLLKCPTGAGKTFSSLRFALWHAQKYQKEKIYYIIPYTSIIDQNAKAIKDILGNDEFVQKNVYELHASLTQEPGQENENGEYRVSSRRLSERLEQPIILTTMVRFLNTFFSGKRKYERGLHQFSNAVIIFDEVQTVPVKTIHMFNGAVNFLTKACHSTCVLCTATQSSLHQSFDFGSAQKTNAKSVIESIQLAPEKDLFDTKHLQDQFKRVTLQDARKTGGYSAEDLSEFTMQKAQKEQNILVVMNTKKSALKLFREIEKKNEQLKEEQKYQLYFLSTWLCVVHRKEIIEQLKQIKSNDRVIVVSTQLIEAGVDLDFNCVIRSLAGLDSIIQAAGRCNRQGKGDLKEVYIINADKELEIIRSLRDIREGQAACEEVLNYFKETPEDFDYNLMGEKATQRYFKLYWTRQKEIMNYPISKSSSDTVYHYLADNKEAMRSYMTRTNTKKPLFLPQAFASAGKAFEAIETDGISLIIPYGKGEEIIADLVSDSIDYDQKKTLLSRAQQYSINLSQNDLRQYKDLIHVYENEGLYVVLEQYYDEVLGFTGEHRRQNKTLSY